MKFSNGIVKELDKVQNLSLKKEFFSSLIFATNIDRCTSCEKMYVCGTYLRTVAVINPLLQDSFQSYYLKFKSIAIRINLRNI